jgi:hypothetical protein
VAIDGRLISWDEFGELLRSTVGWSFQLRLGLDAEARVGRAPVQAGELEPPERIVLEQEPPRWFVVDLDH